MSFSVFPYFQPIIETATGRVAGYEALARMEDENGNVVSAGPLFSDKSIPVEQRIEVDRKVRLQALQALDILPEDTYLSINISPEWLQYLESFENLPTLEMIKKVAGDPSRIVIEITELDGDLSTIQKLVERYRAHGCKVAIDDFGSGFSQLDRITILKPDIIKLDMTLLQKGAQDIHGASMVQMLGQLASRLGSKVVCEGVETDEDYYLALSCNAVYTQGFLFAKAEKEMLSPTAPVNQVKQLLENYQDMAIDATSRNNWRVDKVKSELLALRELLKSSSDNDQLQHFVAAKHLLRFYICDRQGNQISPNYENSELGWIADEKHQGYNWSWRPYFFKLLGASDIHNRLVFSAPYQDIHNGHQAQTAVLFIDEQRILLADLLDDQQNSQLFSALGGMTDSWVPELN